MCKVVTEAVTEAFNDEEFVDVLLTSLVVFGALAILATGLGVI